MSLDPGPKLARFVRFYKRMRAVNGCPFPYNSKIHKWGANPQDEIQWHFVSRGYAMIRGPVFTKEYSVRFLTWAGREIPCIPDQALEGFERHMETPAY